MPQGAEFKFRVSACNAGGSGEPAEIPGTVKITEMLGESVHSKKMAYHSVINAKFYVIAVLFFSRIP